MTDPEKSEAWRSYLMPDTNTLRTLAGFADPVAASLFERITSATRKPPCAQQLIGPAPST